MRLTNIKGTPDFLTGITNPTERKVKEEYKKGVPRTAAEMAERYENSAIRQDVLQEMAEYEKFLETEV
jgi:ATP-binding cassette subfamily G (WHITE) protein 2 (SNQ2)